VKVPTGAGSTTSGFIERTEQDAGIAFMLGIGGGVNVG
jgi:hypothetical protein